MAGRNASDGAGDVRSKGQVGVTGGLDELDGAAAHPGDRGSDADPELVPNRDLDRDPDDPELSLALPEWLNATIDRRRQAWTRVDAVAALAIVVHLGLLGVIVGRGSLYLDDLRVQAAAHGTSLADYMFHPASGPFAPVPALLDWLQTDRYPLDHSPSVLVTLLVRALLAVAFWRLLRRLLGPRLPVLLPLLLLLITPALLPATTWYRPSVTVLAAVTGAVWALDAFVAWQLMGRRRLLATIFVATLLACCCNLVAVVVPVVLVAVQVLVLSRRGTTLRAAGPALAASALAVVLLLAGYLTGSGTVVGTRAGANLITLGFDTLVGSVLPSLLGGPYSWAYPRPYVGTADPSGTVAVFAGIAVLVALGLAVRHSPGRTLRAVLLLAVTGAALLAVVGLSRADAVGPLFTRTDALGVALVPFVLLAAALAGIPWLGTTETDGSAPQRALLERARLAGVSMDGDETGDPAVRAQPLTRRQLREQREGTPAARATSSRGTTSGQAREAAAAVEIGVPAIAAALVVAVLAIGSLASTVTYTQKWWDNPTGSWLTRMQANLIGAEPYPRILATPVPESVFPAEESDIFPSSAPLLQLLRPDIRFHDGDGQSRVLTAAGDLIPPLTTTLGESKQSDLCVATIPKGTTVSRWIRLTQDAVYSPGAQVEVGLLLGESGRVEVKVRTPQGTVLTPTRYSDDDLPVGPHTLHVPVPIGQTVRSVQVTAHVSTATCVSSVRVWAPFT